MSKRSINKIDNTLREADISYRADKIKEIQRLKRNIERRLKRISTNTKLQKQFGEGLNNQAFRSYRKIKRPRNLKTAKDKTVNEYLRRLRQFNKEKFTTVRGYQKYKLWEVKFVEDAFQDVGAIQRKGLLTDLKDKLFEIYGKFVNDKMFVEKYKYDIWRSITSSILEGQTDEQIYQTIMNKYDELLTDTEKSKEQSKAEFEKLYPSKSKRRK